MAREAYISLRELFCIFLQVGCVAFGGFMALISVMADTIVEKRKLLTQDDMLDCISGIFAPRLEIIYSSD